MKSLGNVNKLQRKKIEVDVIVNDLIAMKEAVKSDSYLLQSKTIMSEVSYVQTHSTGYCVVTNRRRLRDGAKNAKVTLSKLSLWIIVSCFFE